MLNVEKKGFTNFSYKSAFKIWYNLINSEISYKDKYKYNEGN